MIIRCFDIISAYLNEQNQPYLQLPRGLMISRIIHKDTWDPGIASVIANFFMISWSDTSIIYSGYAKSQSM